MAQGTLQFNPYLPIVTPNAWQNMSVLRACQLIDTGAVPCTIPNEPDGRASDTRILSSPSVQPRIAMKVGAN